MDLVSYFSIFLSISLQALMGFSEIPFSMGILPGCFCGGIMILLPSDLTRSFEILILVAAVMNFLNSDSERFKEKIILCDCPYGRFIIFLHPSDNTGVDLTRKRIRSSIRNHFPVCLCFVDFGQMEVGMKNRMVGRSLEVRRSQKLLTGIEDLPISLQLEILHRLDLKSAMRCKSVARQWRNLISDPSFANDFVRLHASSVVDRPFAFLLHYVDKQIKKRHLLVTSEEPEFKSLTYIPPIYQHDNIEVTVQALCNDLLLCCANMVGNDAGTGPMSVYYVINPISSQWTALPPMPQLARARVGFICWYDTALHKQLSYRVMRIPEFKGESAEFSVEIFSSDTGKWTQSVGLCPQGFQLDVFAFPGVPYNGLLFWWSSTDCLVGFDPNTSKCCQFFEKPVELNPSHGIERLGVCDGTLRICQISGYPYEVADPCLRVWELKDYDGGK